MTTLSENEKFFLNGKHLVFRAHFLKKLFSWNHFFFFSFVCPSVCHSVVHFSVAIPLISRQNKYIWNPSPKTPAIWPRPGPSHRKIALFTNYYKDSAWFELVIWGLLRRLQIVDAFKLGFNGHLNPTRNPIRLELYTDDGSTQESQFWDL
jgi:hypothetical protein